MANSREARHVSFSLQAITCSGEQTRKSSEKWSDVEWSEIKIIAWIYLPYIYAERLS